MKILSLLTLMCLSACAGTPALAVDTFTLKDYGSLPMETGLQRNQGDYHAFLSERPKFEIAADVTVPASVDLSAKVSPPENQGSCGSCWDFSLTKALRSAWMLIGKDPQTLAFDYLLNNCGPGPRQGGCGGGDFDAGQSFLNGAGPWLESQDPYLSTSGCKSLPAAATAVQFIQVGTGSVPSFKDLAAAVSQQHVLSIDVAVCGSWGNYSSGIFNRNQCGEGSINHMIDMTGYDCETSKDAQGNCLFDAKGEPKNGDGFLIVQNNWGTSWGEKGYMRTRAHVDAVATTAMFFTVSGTPPPPPPPPPVGDYTCSAVNRVGKLFTATGKDQSQTQAAAMAACRKASWKCYPKGCVKNS